MKNCTWKDCKESAKVPLTDKHGREWAALCDTHNVEHEAALDSLNAKKILSAWVKANGGAAKAAERF